MKREWTWHGGALEAAKRDFGNRDTSWIDLSTGINPHGWPGAAHLDIDWQRLPERDAIAALEAEAAAFFGVDPGHVCAVPGSEIGLRLAGRLIGGAAQHLVPAYRTHGEIFAASTPVELDKAKAATTGDVHLVLANPNNPDGRILRPDAVERLQPKQGWLLVDEAFADCMPDISIAARVHDTRRLAVFRSFGKFFGLAGVRLGFVIAPRPLVEEMRALLGAWPVSAAAVAIGRVACADARWIAMTRERLPREAARLDAMLARHGFAAEGACPLFRLVRHVEAPGLFERLARAGIWTRPFAERADWLRIGLPAGDAAWNRLDEALGHG
ncbi:threonine-phosphate decarboxylase [Sphingopyxis sp. MWB1]|uniref:threonine-phosphate decarboxylase n=1 Tax=Sphingopyxis sp. MWB1 TaxID=1537715 RepID=UPI00051A24C4|nr:threonine-phosphate decarboxylase [Sphingopyxis sp. MWB1]